MSSCPSLLKLSSYIAPQHIDLVEGFLFEEAPSRWVLEVNHLTGDGTLSGFYTTTAKRDQDRELIESKIGSIVQFQFLEEEIQEQDWKESYKIHFSPWNYKGVHFIPLWLKNDYLVPKNEIPLLLDPGMAFGTGIHESTRMCLEFLIEDRFCQSGLKSILDLGCGSGILSLLAFLIGFQKVVGLDNDEDAVRISKENAILNDIGNKIDFHNLNLFELEKPIGMFDCVVANIQADILISNADKIIDHSLSESTIVLSGILSKEAEQVLDVFIQKGKYSQNDYQMKNMGEWSSIKFRRI
jgi:ribosomal protein L11 methyltransferase